MLVAVTFLPTIMKLIIEPGKTGNFLFQILFAYIFIFSIFIFGNFLKGFFKSTFYFWILIIGSIIAHFVLNLNVDRYSGPIINFKISELLITPELSIGVLIPILICYIALMANEIGSIKSVYEIMEMEGSNTIIKKTLSLSGVINIISGLFGVCGGANYSISTGIILDNQNASKYPVLFGGITVILLSFFPIIIDIMINIPTIVVGCLLLYIMTMQFSAGLFLFTNLNQTVKKSLYGNIIMGFTLLFAAIVSFIPSEYVLSLPPSFQPFLSNGFVMGLIVVMFLEHIVYREKT